MWMHVLKDKNSAALGEAQKLEIVTVFTNIAEEAGLLDAKLKKKKFLEVITNWEKAVKPAYTEHNKIALT